MALLIKLIVTMDFKSLWWLLILAIVIITTFTLVMVYFFLKQDIKRRRLEILSKDSAEVLKLRFQAYERLTLLLERLSPESLILREQRHDMTCNAFHAHLLKVVRQEFNHNLAMQIYVSINTWNKIKVAREKLVKLINKSAAASNPEGVALELGKIIIEDANIETNYFFIDSLISLKSEIGSYYRV